MSSHDAAALRHLRASDDLFGFARGTTRDGGVLFAISGPDKVWPHCLEAQGQNGEEGDIRNIADFKLNMDQSRVEPKRLRRIGPDSEKPVGEWETIEVIVDHGNLTVKVNGR